ncbi:MAG: tyrosine-type recombinase/integrase [Phycisphaeraceae bacterium JB051]
MPKEPPLPTQEKPGVWITRWRTVHRGVRYQAAKRFYGSGNEMVSQYKQWLKHWRVDYQIQNPRAVQATSVADICKAYLDFAQDYYTKHGKPTTHVYAVQSALQKLVNLYAHTPAIEFDPPKLAAFRDHYDSPDAKRKTINKWIGIIRSAWQWASENGIVHPDLALRLTTVKLLQQGRCKSKEYNVVDAVARDQVDAAIKHMPLTVQHMVELQWCTGMRPGEVCVMRGMDLEMVSPDVWLYRPTEHKGEHIQKDCIIGLGPKAIAIIKPLLKKNLKAYLFDPRETGTNGRTGKRYKIGSYRQAIHRACKRAGIDEWSPHQLRHAKEAEIEKTVGIHAAQNLLRHSSATTTANYGKIEREQRELQEKIELARKLC